MSQASRTKSKEHAAYLKKMQVERTHGMCPWHCGTPIANGGKRLLEHLNTCKGTKRRDSRKKEKGYYGGRIISISEIHVDDINSAYGNLGNEMKKK